MTAYVLRRVLWIIPVLLAVSFVTFMLMHAVPGGPWSSDKQLPAAVIDNLNREYHLDEPLLVQYANYLANLVQGDLGPSFTQSRSVNDIIREGFPKTALLGLVAFSFALVVGLTLGIFSALNQNGPIDNASVFFATFGASVPSFILAVFLIMIFGVTLEWLPVLGWGSWQNVIMPALALGLLPASYIARITRASVIEVLRQDYIRTARAKGLAEHTVTLRHMLKNALIPVLTLAGPLAAALVTGSFIIERMFVIPGIGRSFVDGVFSRDYGVIMGTTIFYAFIVAVANLIVDLLYAVVDPRIRYS